MSADKNHSTRWHCQQICQQKLGERVKAGKAELRMIDLVSSEQTPENIEDLRLIGWLLKPAGEDLTTQAQRPGPREAWMATGMRWPGSLQRMVRHHGHTASMIASILASGRP